MKKYSININFVLVVLIALINTSCNGEYLDTPPDHLIEGADFFKTEEQLQSYINGLYDMLPGQSVYDEDASSDNIIPLLVSDRVRGNRLVPVESGSGGWSWENLRTINYFLQNSNKVNNIELELKYNAYAKFFRALFYFNKVKLFGDVPWYDKVLEAGDNDLYKARDSRKVVMQNVLDDLNNAIEYLPSTVEVNAITKYTALMLKARVCLYEGSFRKYHNLGDFEDFLNEAINASETLINSGVYTLYNNGDVNTSYGELFNMYNQTSTETILARDFNSDYLTHNIGNLATSPTNGSYGATKDLINSYLLTNGSRFTDLPNYETLEFFDEMQNRDPRLTTNYSWPWLYCLSRR